MMLKRILKSKRGLALENAILFMLIIFSLCALLSTLTMIGHYNLKLDKVVFLRDVAIDQIGEDYLASAASGTAFDTDGYDKYACNVENGILTVWNKEDETKRVLLYVEIDTDGEKPQVVAWRYSLPSPSEDQN